MLIKMNRNQRRYGRIPRKIEPDTRTSKVKSKEEVRGAADNTRRTRENASSPSKDAFKEKIMMNRCCYVSPDRKDFGQVTDDEVDQQIEQYQSLLIEQYGFEPSIPDSDFKALNSIEMFYENAAKTNNASQYDPDKVNQDYVEMSDGSQWQNVNSAEEIDRLIIPEKESVAEAVKSLRSIAKDIHISNVPRVKIIAEKFSRCKKNNIELRKLEEKVVCVEYDVFDHSSVGDLEKPVQTMRAFFSVKPVYSEQDENLLKQLPSSLVNFNPEMEGLKKFNVKEIEIIDDKIFENKPYLDDMRKILKRKQIIRAKKNKTSLDLQSLYQMARKERVVYDCEYSNPNLLSKAGLQEIKDLILHKCTSSVHGISRRTLKGRSSDVTNKSYDTISQSIVTELLKPSGKVEVRK